MKLTLFSFCPQPITTETVSKNVVDVVSDNPGRLKRPVLGGVGLGEGLEPGGRVLMTLEPVSSHGMMG